MSKCENLGEMGNYQPTTGVSHELPPAVDLKRARDWDPWLLGQARDFPVN